MKFQNREGRISPDADDFNLTCDDPRDILPASRFHFCAARSRTLPDASPPAPSLTFAEAFRDDAPSAAIRSFMSRVNMERSGCPSGIPSPMAGTKATIGSISVSGETITPPPPLMPTSYHRTLSSASLCATTESALCGSPDNVPLFRDHASAAAIAISSVTSAQKLVVTSAHVTAKCTNLIFVIAFVLFLG